MNISVDEKTPLRSNGAPSKSGSRKYFHFESLTWLAEGGLKRVKGEAFRGGKGVK